MTKSRSTPSATVERDDIIRAQSAQAMDDPLEPTIESDDDEYDAFFDTEDFDWSLPLSAAGDSDDEPDRPEDPTHVRTSHQPPRRNPGTNFTSGYEEAVESTLDEDLIADKTEEVIEFLKSKGLTLSIFLNAVFWGNPRCIANGAIKHQRTTFMNSKYLGPILDRCWRPPRDLARNGHDTIRNFAFGCTQEILTEEMNTIAPRLRAGPGEPVVSHETLTSVDFKEFGTWLRDTGAPMLWMLLLSLAWGTRQARKNTTKDPFYVCLTL